MFTYCLVYFATILLALVSGLEHLDMTDLCFIAICIVGDIVIFKRKK